MARQRQRVKSLGSNDAGAVNRLTDYGMLFENLDVKTLFSQQSCGETTGWPATDNNNIMHEQYSELPGKPDIFLLVKIAKYAGTLS
jgi:hypothetical protein